MIEQYPTLTLLIKQLQRIPYLASKNIFRVAEYFLSMNEQAMQLFCRTLMDVKAHTIKCEICCTWKEKDQACSYCHSSRRDKRTICVVASWYDLMIVEKTSGYTGVYHVLGGIICPLDGIGPEDLSIDLLITRVEQCEELIFAFSQTPEGEATAAYIATKVKDKNIRITCLARGLPVGSSLESMDRLTVFKALSERRPF